LASALTIAGLLGYCLRATQRYANLNKALAADQVSSEGDEGELSVDVKCRPRHWSGAISLRNSPTV
jgi:hypothetical protein